MLSAQAQLILYPPVLSGIHLHSLCEEKMTGGWVCHSISNLKDYGLFNSNVNQELSLEILSLLLFPYRT